jgi:putative glycosyltransferase (TIGR04372 family)
LYFSIHHKIAAKLGNILNAIILSPHPDSIGNASEEIFFATLRAKKENKKLIILHPKKFIQYFIKNIKFYDKSFFNIDCDYFYFKQNSFWQNFWSNIWSIYFIFANITHGILKKIFNIKSNGHYWRPSLGQDIIWRPNINSNKFDLKLFKNQYWKEQFKEEINFNFINEKKLKIDLNNLGISENDWFVCLHVREGGFKKDWDNPLNANIENYIDAINEIVNRGGNVIRVGDNSMTKLPNIKGLIDYPFTTFKNSEMDLYLLKKCKFFICMGSGPLDAANLLFRKRLLLTNTAQYLHGLPFNKGSYAIFKQVYSKNKKRFLSVREYMLDAENINNKWWISDDHQLYENNKKEIKQAVIEMLDYNDSLPRTYLQNQFRTQYEKCIKIFQNNFKFSSDELENTYEWYRSSPRMNYWEGEISNTYLDSNWEQSSRNKT